MDYSDRLLANAIVTVPLPGKLPIRPYMEFMTYTDLDTRSWNKSKSAMIYNVGIEVRLIPSFLSVYFNLYQSEDVTTRQESAIGVDKFMERATFTLNLSKLINSKPEDIRMF